MKLNRNKALAMFASFIILTAAIGIGVWSIGSSSIITITPPSLNSPYSYTVFTDGSTVYMKNGTTGQIDYTSSNASKLLQFAAGNLSLVGGTVFVKDGLYYVDSTIYLNYSGVTIQGETWGIDVYGTRLQLTTVGIPMFYIGGTAPAHTWFVTIKNMELFGNGVSGTTGILINGDTYTSDVWFENLFIYRFSGSGIVIKAHTYKVWNIWILQCLIEESGLYGVYLTDATDVVTRNIDRVTIQNCHFYGNLNSVRSDTPCVYDLTFSLNTVEQERQSSVNCTGGRNWNIQDNHIFDCGTDATNTFGAVYVNGTGALGYGGNPEAWLILGNHFGDQFAPHMNYSVWLTGNITGFQVKNNGFLSLSSAYRGDGLTAYSSNVVVEGNSVAVANEDVSTASYTVFTDGTTTFMRNGSTGRVDYQSSNASKLFGFAVGNLTWGGTISVKAGVYNIDSTILLNKIGVKILGETWGINDYGVVFNLTTSGIPMFNITGVSPNHIWFVTIEDVELRGNALANSVGVLIGGETYTSDVTLDRVFLNGFAYGLKISALTQKVWNIWLRDSLIETNTKAGVYFTGTSHYLTNMIDRVTIENCHFALNLNSLYCDTPHVYHVSFVENSVELETQTSINATGGRNWVVSNNRMLDCGSSAVNTYGCIKVNGSNTAVMCWPQGWRISDNTLQNHFTGNMNYSVWLTGLIADFDVHDNNFANTTTTFRQDGLNATSYGNKFHDNNGFVTENTVLNAANTTATTFVFNHGLANTANSVQVSFNFTGWTSWTWTSTTTQVTITITGTLPAAMGILAADVKYIP